MWPDHVQLATADNVWTVADPYVISVRDVSLILLLHPEIFNGYLLSIILKQYSTKLEIQTIRFDWRFRTYSIGKLRERGGRGVACLWKTLTEASRNPRLILCIAPPKKKKKKWTWRGKWISNEKRDHHENWTMKNQIFPKQMSRGERWRPTARRFVNPMHCQHRLYTS